MCQPRGGEREQRSRLGSMALPLLPCFVCLKHHKNQKSDGSSLFVLVLTVLRGVIRQGKARWNRGVWFPRRRGRRAVATWRRHISRSRRTSRGRRPISSAVPRTRTLRGAWFGFSR